MEQCLGSRVWGVRSRCCVESQVPNNCTVVLSLVPEIREVGTRQKIPPDSKPLNPNPTVNPKP